MLGSLFRRRKAATAPANDPALPDGLRIYAIGDVHGRIDLLDRMADLIADDIARTEPCDAYTVLLGDYVDRGLASAAVLDRLSSGQFPTGIVPLLGNHEAVLRAFLDDVDVFAQWRAIGGFETLYSYGGKVGNAAVTNPEATRRAFLELIPPLHLDFLSSLEPSHSVGDYFFCHAGVRPGVPLDQQREQDLIWIREAFLDSTEDFGKVIVHGHTPSEEPVLRRNRIGIDTGAYATGRLTCLRLQENFLDFIVAER
jgi:serine/threonine protein phosphatase 1